MSRQRTLGLFVGALAALLGACGQQEPAPPPMPQTLDAPQPSEAPPAAVMDVPSNTVDEAQVAPEPPPVETAEPLEAAPEAPTADVDIPSEADTTAMEELIHGESIDEAPEPENLPEGDWMEEVPMEEPAEEIYQEEGVIDGGVSEDGILPEDETSPEIVDEEEEEVPPGVDVPAADALERTESSGIE